MVEQVEELCAEIKSCAFPRQHEPLDQREVCVHKTRAIERCPRQGTELSKRCIRESAGIEPSSRCTQLIWRSATWVGGNLACFVRVSNLNRTCKSRPVLRELHASIICACHEKQWEARADPFNHVDGPSAENLVDGSIPSASKLFPATEWQIVQHTCCELMVQLDLRESPIQLVSSRQRPIGRADIAAQSVRQSAIEVSCICIPQQRVQSMPHTLCLSLRLQRVVAS